MSTKSPKRPTTSSRKAAEDVNKLKKAMAEQQERIRMEKARRRKVFEAICVLSDPVSAEILIEQMRVLDVLSWNEVVEERFLSRLCGYPICEQEIKVDLRKRFVIDKMRNAVYDVNHEVNKYCSNRCLGLSRGVQLQLSEQPLWITGERPPRVFKIPESHEEFLPADISSVSFSEQEVKFLRTSKTSVPELVKHVENLKIADHVQSDSDDDTDKEDEIGGGRRKQAAANDSEEEREEREFLASIKSYMKRK